METKKSLVAGIFLVAASTSHAALIAYDGFNTVSPDGENVANASSSANQIPGVDYGWADSYKWASHGGSGVLVQSPGLSVSGYAGAGKTSSADGTNFGVYNRSFSTDTLTAWQSQIDTGGQIWVSFFIAQNTPYSTAGSAGLRLNGAAGTNNLSIGAYTWSDKYWSYGDGVVFGEGQSGLATKVDRDSTITKMTVCLDYRDVGKTYISAYLNQGSDALGSMLSASEKSIDSVLSYTGIGLVSTAANSFSVDEIRIGTSVGDVTSIPEPSTYALVAGVGLLGLLAIRRRR